LKRANQRRKWSTTISKTAENLSKAGWSWGRVSTVDSHGRTIFIADAHRGDGKRFVVRADERLTAFVELESAVRAWGELA
jgi:precorrin-6B methylase 1